MPHCNIVLRVTKDCVLESSGKGLVKTGCFRYPGTLCDWYINFNGAPMILMRCAFAAPLPLIFR